MAGALPNLLVIGAMKSGTSSLHYYLGLHPEIQMSQPKELHFFLDRGAFAPDELADEVTALEEQCNWRRGTDWYRGHFDEETPIRGESSVAYTYPWYLGTAGRIAEVLPDVRLIYLVRDPVERMASHWETHAQTGREERPLAEALAQVPNRYLAASRYRSALDPFLALFERERILIVDHADLLDRRRATLAEIHRFLEVDPAFWSPAIETMRNRSAGKGGAYRMAERLRASRAAGPLIQRLPAAVKVRAEGALAARTEEERPGVDPALRSDLLTELEPEVAGLEELTGRDFSHWRSATA
jgi:Sulfotransferase family